ncbi:MAG TPA: hypothetical protein VF109_11180 [Mycobacteriales bacterium]
MRRDDDNELPGEGRGPGGDPSWLESVVVPDDISALDADVRALHREQRAAARSRRLRRLFPLDRLSAPVVIVALLLASGVIGLLVVLQPRRTGPGSGPVAPLATSSSRVGEAGGLVPDVRLSLADGSTKSVRDYRPAVLALVPAGCACDPALRESSLAAARHQVVFVQVDATPPPAPTARGDRGAVLRGTDATGTIARAYGVTGPRARGGPLLVLVAGDGRVTRVLTGAADRRTLDNELAALAPA